MIGWAPISPGGAARWVLTLTHDAGLSPYLDDVSPSDRRWSARRLYGEQLEEIFAGVPYQVFAKWSPRLHTCSQILEFGWSPERDPELAGVLRLKLKTAWFCRVPLCPVCMWRKGLVWLARFHRALPDIQKTYPAHRWIFLTLTARNVPVVELRSSLREAHKGFDRLTKRSEWKGAIPGWIRSTEVTKGKDAPGMSHPHLHLLCLVPASYFGPLYIKQARWVELWRDCARLDYDPVVDVRTVKPKPGEAYETALASALRETFKYSVKASELELGDRGYVVELARALRHMRMVRAGGVLAQFFTDVEPEQAELIGGDGDGETVGNEGGVFFKWRVDGAPKYRRIGEWENRTYES